jgi:hypothetical protein
MEKPKKRQIPYRDHTAVVDALEQQGDLRGRTLSTELRLAVRLWLREALLAQLADPVGRAEAEAEGHDVDADEKALRKEIADIKRRAFARPIRIDLRDALEGHEVPLR